MGAMRVSQPTVWKKPGEAAPSPPSAPAAAGDIYVLYSERDCSEVSPDNQPIILEQRVDQSSLAEVAERQRQQGAKYGKTRVAKLVFLDDDQMSTGVAADDIHVVVSERDTFRPVADSHPIIFEQYANHASLTEVQAFQRRLGDQYGKTRVAKLVFLDETAD